MHSTKCILVVESDLKALSDINFLLIYADEN